MISGLDLDSQKKKVDCSRLTKEREEEKTEDRAERCSKNLKEQLGKVVSPFELFCEKSQTNKFEFEHT